MRAFFTEPFRDAITCLERLLLEGRALPGLMFSTVALIATWFVYVPVHEMLHVTGCLVAGGSISRLDLAPQYGGTLLARVFPFVVSGGDYAGRLSGFDHKDSDLIYLATDFLPFALTILFGVPWMKACARRRRPVVFGAAIVMGLAPIYNLPGDYYEMGSILMTRLAKTSGVLPGEAAMALRSDDIFRLIGEIFEHPENFGLAGGLRKVVVGTVVIASLVTGVLLALATYHAGSGFARWLERQRAKAA